jgi:hypothetical protein
MPKLQPKLAPLLAVLQKAQKAVQRGDFENHSKTISEVRPTSTLALGLSLFVTNRPLTKTLNNQA